jgi:hypothetical protein
MKKQEQVQEEEQVRVQAAALAVPHSVRKASGFPIAGSRSEAMPRGGVAV